MRLFTDVASSIHDPMLRRAYELAEQGRGTTSPNPLVGCVIAQDDEIVGEGFHARAGGSHAEVVALAQAGPRAAGSTAYVTLEPCNHFGKTPPCSETLITRGVAGVVIGLADPNPVAVGGAMRLREAGLEVEFEADPTPYQIQNEAWLHWVETAGEPFVQIKTALTLDGHPSMAPGVRSRITGDGGATLTQRLRSAADAVVVGAATARIDEPALTLRDSEGNPLPADRQPLRVVIGRGDIPDASLFHDGLGQAVALAPPSATTPPGVERIDYDPAGGLRGAMRVLGALGIVRVLVEAGPQLFTAFQEQSAAHEYVVVAAGGFAGPRGAALFGGEPTGTREQLEPVVAPLESGILGSDAVTTWRPIHSVGTDVKGD